MKRMTKRLVIKASLILLATATPNPAQMAYTTNPSPSVPTPESILGHRPGDDVGAYFPKLPLNGKNFFEDQPVLSERISRQK
jgi:hypothetical protein